MVVGLSQDATFRYDDRALEGRDVADRSVHQVAVHEERRAGGAGDGLDAAFLGELGDQALGQLHHRIAAAVEIARRVVDVTVTLRARDHHQRSVGGGHVVEEQADHQCSRTQHAVLEAPGGVVLVPPPALTVEGRLGVDARLVDVDVAAEQLPGRFDPARVTGQPAVHVVETVRAVDQPNGVVGALADHFRADRSWS